MRLKLVITKLGEDEVTKALQANNLPVQAIHQILEDTRFDLDEDGLSKLSRCGDPNERQYRVNLHNFGGFLWLHFEIDFDASPTEARIIGCTFTRFYSR